MARNDAFDSLKGLLIILVIMGHVLLGSISENLGREIIYFFHMPIFLAVTGYFTKNTFIGSSSYDILKKCKNRFLIPFLIAFVFYSSLIIIHLYQYSDIEIKNIAAIFLYPYYHLWYIPAIILFIFYTKILSSVHYSFKYLLIVTFIASTIFFEGYGQNVSNHLLFKIFGDKRFYYFFSYFYLGYFLSNKKFKINFDLMVSLLIIGLLIYGYGQNAILIGIGKTVANICLIIVIFSLIEKNSYKSTFLAKVGEVTLPIYLWHVAPLLILKKLPISENMYYLSSIIFYFVFIFVIVKFKHASKVVDKYIYGKPSQAKKILLHRQNNNILVK